MAELNIVDEMKTYLLVCKKYFISKIYMLSVCRGSVAERSKALV